MSLPPARRSFESDREHLLANPSLCLPPPENSAALASSSPSTIPTPALPSTAELVPPAPTPYRGFPSEEAYLDALRAWVMEKTHAEFDTAVSGFYGRKTMQDYAAEPVIEFAWRTRMKERKAEKQKAKLRLSSEASSDDAEAAAAKADAKRWRFGRMKRAAL